MELYDLTVFMAVVDTGGFTLAAKQLNCVQPNVTARIKKLETSLGVQLFYRENRGVSLTASGRELIGEAKQLLHLAANTKARFSNKHVSGVLNLGVSQTAATAWLPGILREFMKNYPDVEINVQSLFMASMTAQLLNHELDCALTDIPVEHPRLRYTFSHPQQLMLVSARDYQISAGTEVTVLNFSKVSQYRRILYDSLHNQHIRITHELILKGMDAVLSCIIGGLGVSVLPKSVTSLPHIAPYITAQPIQGKKGKAGIVCHVNNIETPALQAFTELTQKTIENHQNGDSR